MPLVLHVLEAAGTGVLRHVRDIVSRTPGIEHHAAVPPPATELRSGAVYEQHSISALSAAGVEVHFIEMRRSAMSVRNVQAAGRVRRLIGEVEPHVVHGHSSIGGAVARIASAGTRTPVAYTPHAMAAGWGYRRIERMLGPLTARVIAVSESEREAIITRGLMPPWRVTAIPNGIDLGPIVTGPDLRNRLGLPTGTPLIGTVARLIPQKAPTQFVAVCERIASLNADAHFVLIGMGPLQNEVDRAVDDARLRPRWHQIERLENAAAVLDQLDVFVLASRFEGGPYAPLEAMRAGTPVVLSDVVGNRDIVEDGVSGFLRPFGDTPGMAASIDRLLADPSLRAQIREAARTRLAARFDAASMGERLANLYCELARLRDLRRSTRRLPQLSAASSVQSPASSAANKITYGGRPPSAGSGNTSWIAKYPSGTTFGVHAR
jgi:glycosyltransferase involved in cell wall biosynthesis